MAILMMKHLTHLFFLFVITITAGAGTNSPNISISNLTNGNVTIGECDNVCCLCGFLSTLEFIGIKLGFTLLAAAGSAIALPLIINLTINILGCRVGGIAAGSPAAFVMSLIGNVVGGSAFAVVQSIGALGGIPFWSPVGIVGAVIGAILYLYFSISSYVNSECKTDCGCCDGYEDELSQLWEKVNSTYQNINTSDYLNQTNVFHLWKKLNDTYQNINTSAYKSQIMGENE